MNIKSEDPIENLPANARVRRNTYDLQPKEHRYLSKYIDPVKLSEESDDLSPSYQLDRDIEDRFNTYA